MSEPSRNGIIAWFANNPVAANLLMLIIIGAGLVSSISIRKQTTPDFELNRVSIRVPYLGAAPAEVEEGVTIKVEEAIQDVAGLDEIRSTSSEGLGSVTAIVSLDKDIDQVLADIKTRVDAISTFPGLAEKPLIYKSELPFPVIMVSIYGDLDEFDRKLQGQKLRDALMSMPEVNSVENFGDRDYEISVEIPERTLREYGLTMSDVATAIRASSIDLPGGTIKAESGNILLRTEGQRYRGLDFGQIVLRTFADGTRLTVADIADIDDGFVEVDGYGQFNGVDSVTMQVLAAGQQNELKTAAVIKDFIAEYRKDMPDGVYLDVWVDRAHYLQDRLDMMLSNMLQGAILVFLVLSLFLRLKVALWVIVGIPVTFLGTLAFMPLGPWPVTVNVISLFAFILVLGIVVDDAIIIGESVYTKIRADGHTVDNVVAGAQRVATAATFGVLTTIAAFAPMLFVGGLFAPFLEAVAVVVSLSLLFSLVESKLILPSHLAHAHIAPVNEDEIFAPYRGGPIARVTKFFQRIQRRFQHWLQHVIQNRYKPTLAAAVRNRGITVTLFVAALILTFGLILSGAMRVVLFPKVPGDYVMAELEMENGTSPQRRNDALRALEQALFDATDEYTAANPGVMRPIRHAAVWTEGDVNGNIITELPLDESRPMDIFEVTSMWRDAVPPLPGVKSLEFTDGQNVGGDKAISFAVTGPDYESLRPAAEMLHNRIREYSGIIDLEMDYRGGGDEIELMLKPEAESLGITMTLLGQQVRQAFYGEEAQRIQRGKDEIKVMVRYPEEERRSIANLRQMRILTPSGAEVPFESVATIRLNEALTSIKRLDRERSIKVSANVDYKVAQPTPIINELTNEFIPEITARYPSISVRKTGSAEEEAEFAWNATLAAVAALTLIYMLIAVPLKSYSQPLIIMSVIPYGLIGAVIGHLIFNEPISMFSIIGLIALSGVVVNDSLIMTDFINKARAAGHSIYDAVLESGAARFRAIILTSLTTSLGLLPIIFEKSVQAQWVIPMAISLCFGILFATVITLFLIPSLYMLLDDLKRFFRRLFTDSDKTTPDRPVELPSR
ncbi:MAG: efflux RND transporter permease subunit [Pseudomonadota bacterium]